MIDWIKFSERQPEKDGLYLSYYEEAEIAFILSWKASGFYTMGFSISVMDRAPDYWAEINPPLTGRFIKETTAELFKHLKKEPLMPEKPLCKDCRWMTFLQGFTAPRCGHEEAKRSFVDGQPERPCWEIRAARFEGDCGPEGSWFEAEGKALTPYEVAGARFLKELEDYQRAVKDYIEGLESCSPPV